MRDFVWLARAVFVPPSFRIEHGPVSRRPLLVNLRRRRQRCLQCDIRPASIPAVAAHPDVAQGDRASPTRALRFAPAKLTSRRRRAAPTSVPTSPPSQKKKARDSGRDDASSLRWRKLPPQAAIIGLSRQVLTLQSCGTKSMRSSSVVGIAHGLRHQTLTKHRLTGLASN